MDSSRSGQSLLELLIAIIVGMIFMVGISIIITSSVSVSGQATKIQTAAASADSLLNNVRVWSEANWSNVLSLATGSANQYYLITSSSPYTVSTSIQPIVQIEVENTVSTGSGSMTATFTTSTNVGELVTVGVVTALNGNLPAGVTDNKGDVYTLAYGASGIASHYSNSLYYLANAPAGITTITVTENTGDTAGAIVAAHYSGIATTNALDVFSTPNTVGSSSPWMSGAATTTQSNELLVGTDYARLSSGGTNCTIAASGNWIQDELITNPNLDAGNGSAAAYAHEVASTIGGSVVDTGTNPAGTCLNYSGIATFKGIGGNYFYFLDAYRTPSGAVTSTASGNTYDPSTKQLWVVYSGTNGATSTMTTYLTRNHDDAFDQTDWSGGPTSTGVATSIGNQFATSSNIDYSTSTGAIYVAIPGY